MDFSACSKDSFHKGCLFQVCITIALLFSRGGQRLKQFHSCVGRNRKDQCSMGMYVQYSRWIGLERALAGKHGGGRLAGG